MDKAGTSVNGRVDIAALEPMADFEVPVKEGYTTIVSLDGEQLAVTRQPMTISVPAYAAKQTGRLDVTYSDEDIFGEFSYVSYWHYLSFEDTRKGDYDYNDVVLHCRVITKAPGNFNGTQTCKHTVYVQPVALGSSVRLGLGILYRNDAGEVTEQILTDDIRRDLYKGDVSFPINTDLSKPLNKISNILTQMFECTTHVNNFPVVWFIDNGTDRLYAATTNFGADRKFGMISEDGLPYGIALTQKWCYPVESCHIWDAYPNFYQWLKSGDQTVLLSDRVKANTYYPAIQKNGADGDLWDYDK